MLQLIPILILAAVVVAFGAILLLLFSLLGPKVRATAAKNMPYECGVPGQDAPHTKISVKFYLTAILFILFDIEVIFMYPWAVTFSEFVKEGAGPYIFGSMMFFLFIFVFGLFWEVKSKALEWE